MRRLQPGARARGVKRYAEVLRVPHVAPLIAATLIARFPIGINALALILYLRHATGSFAVAGVVAGGLAAGAGIGAPVQGRLVDSFGQRRVLVPLAFVHATALGSVVAFAELGAPTVVLVACSVSAGFAIPPTSSVLRSMWPSLLRDREELLQPAYALDSVLIELIFILGPLLTAVLTAAVSPASALLVSVASVITGTIWFTALAPTPRVRARPRARATSRFGALVSPGVRSLVLTSLPAGVGIGIGRGRAAGVLRRHGRRRAGRPAAGGVVARQRRGRADLRRAAEPPAARAPAPRGQRAAPARPAAAGGRVVGPGDGAAGDPGGRFIAPLLATRNELIGWVAPPGARTEAYTWPVTAFVGRHRDRLGALRHGRRVAGLAGLVPHRRGGRGGRHGRRRHAARTR